MNKRLSRWAFNLWLTTLIINYGLICLKRRIKKALIKRKE